MEGTWEVGQSKVWQRGILVLLHCPSKDRENPQFSGLSPFQALLPPHTAPQTKDKLEQGTKKDLVHQGLRADRQGTWIQSNDTSKETKDKGPGVNPDDASQRRERMRRQRPWMLSAPAGNIPATSQTITWCPEGRSQERCWGLVSEWNTSSWICGHRQAWLRLLGHYLEKTIVMIKVRGCCGGLLWGFFFLVGVFCLLVWFFWLRGFFFNIFFLIKQSAAATVLQH